MASGTTPLATQPAPTMPPGTNNLPLQGTVGGSGAWTNAAGMTLYIFSADTSDVSYCTVASGCANDWPPLVAPTGSVTLGSFTPISRSDGGMQWAFQGCPLYTYDSDSKPGDNNGNMLYQSGGMWTTARPAGMMGFGGMC